MSPQRQRSFSNRQQHRRPPIPNECLGSNLSKIITEIDSAEQLVRCADKLGEHLEKGVTTSQLRAWFGEVKQIEAQWKSGQKDLAERRLILLKPKMAYRAARQEKNNPGPLHDLKDLLEQAIDLVTSSSNKDQSFANFVAFFEAILAYHKAHGGKD